MSISTTNTRMKWMLQSYKKGQKQQNKGRNIQSVPIRENHLVIGETIICQV